MFVCACIHVYMYRYVCIHMWEVDLGSEVLGSRACRGRMRKEGLGGRDMGDVLDRYVR